MCCPPGPSLVCACCELSHLTLKISESEVASCCLKAKDLCPLAMPTAPCFTWQGVFHQPCLLTAGNLIFQGTFKMVKASSQSLPPQSWHTLWSIWNLWDITLQLTKNLWKGRVMQVKTHQCSPPSCISKDKALSTVASVYLRIRRWCGLGFLKAAHSLSLISSLPTNRAGSRKLHNCARTHTEIYIYIYITACIMMCIIIYTYIYTYTQLHTT